MGAIIAAGGAVVAPSANATTGGPELSEALGFDFRTNEVYFLLHQGNATGNAATVFSLNLMGRDHLFQAVPWSVDTLADSAYEAHLAGLKKRLRPLEEIAWTTIADNRRVESADAVRKGADMRARFGVRARWFVGGDGAGWVKVIAYDEPSVRLTRLYAVPGKVDRIGVISYVGVPFEDGYEVQVPLRFPRSGFITTSE